MSLEAILAQYQKNEKPAVTGKKADLKKYFTTYLAKGENSKTKRIRILPAMEGQSTPFIEVMGHSIQVNGEWKKFICPKHQNNEPCPFCEAREALLASGKESDKEIAKTYNAKKMYVVKVIDRDFEDDGVKFWRFNHSYKKDGIFDKIVGLIAAGVGDFTNPETGRDLLINISRDSQGRPTVSSIVPSMEPNGTPLSSNKTLASEFLADTDTWDTVFPIKPYEYLEIIVMGGDPMYDKETKKFVDRATIEASKDLSKEDEEDYDSELTMGSVAVAVDVTKPVSTTITNGDGEVDDLPF